MSTSIPQNPTNVSLNQAASTAPITQEPQEQAKPTLVSVPPAPSPSTQKTEEALANKKPQTFNTEKFKKLDALTSKFVTAQEAGIAGKVPGQTRMNFLAELGKKVWANKWDILLKLAVIAFAAFLTVSTFGAALAAVGAAEFLPYFILAMMAATSTMISIVKAGAKVGKLSKEVEAEHVARHQKIAPKDFTKDDHFVQLQQHMAAFAQKIDNVEDPKLLLEINNSIRDCVDNQLISLRKNPEQFKKEVGVLEDAVKILDDYQKNMTLYDQASLSNIKSNLKTILADTIYTMANEDYVLQGEGEKGKNTIEMEKILQIIISEPPQSSTNP